VILRGLDRPFQIVDDRQEFLQELLIAESDLIPEIPLSEPLVIVEFGGQPEILVVERLEPLVLGLRLSGAGIEGSGRTIAGI
jgi:hypothetical protein